MNSVHHFGKLSIICKDLENSPHCSHGPSLLFERTDSNGMICKFYACSAYKSRKECPFFMPYESVAANKTIESANKKRCVPIFNLSHKSLCKRFLKVKELNSEKRSYCHTCSILLVPEENASHKTHNVCRNISDFQLDHPSQLLHLKTNSKGESQFIFTKKSIEIVIDGLKKLKVRKVLCLGTPSIHERITLSEDKMTSLFLDIDYRYSQFYDETKFCWFNMMNFYFFENTKAFERVKRFLESSNVVLIMDPPFSAREEPLAYTLSKFNSLYQSSNASPVLPVVWIFPYFKENEVLSSWPGMIMLDYDVTYTNQKQFKGKNKTSVVRIFTNLDASKFVFPIEEGYNFCSKCRRWVSKFNKHCFKCGICPSKNGHPYKHCNMCSRCVKEYWCHCNKCGRCALKQHPCDLWQEGKKESTKKRKLEVQYMQSNPTKKSKKEVINVQTKNRFKKKLFMKPIKSTEEEDIKKQIIFRTRKKTKNKLLNVK